MLTIAAGKLLAAAAAASVTVSMTALAAGFFWQTDVTPPDMREIAMPGGDALLIAVHEVTHDEWIQCADDGGCSFQPEPDAALDGKRYPVTGVNALDVAEYIAWINKRSGLVYRLPTSGEWKVAAAELPQPQYQKLFTDPRLDWAADYGAMPRVSGKRRESGAFGAFKNGVADMTGNVWEWTSSCVVKADVGRCPAYLVEGLHEAKLSALIREPAQGGCTTGTPPPHVGFRLVREVARVKG